MSPEAWIALAVLVTAVMAHAAASIWWASKITTSLAFMVTNFTRLDRELEKRDRTMEKMWERIDEFRSLIITK